jgi:hypothetical protein
VLLLDAGHYKPIAASVLRLRLRELGLEALCVNTRGRQLTPAAIIREHGKIVSREEYAAAERGE